MSKNEKILDIEDKNEDKKGLILDLEEDEGDEIDKEIIELGFIEDL